MSILVHDEIIHEYNNYRIHINPFDERSVGPNSVDVRLDSKLKVYKLTSDEYLDTRSKNSTTIIEIPSTGLVLRPGVLYLGTTVDEIGSDHHVPMYEGRSSMARLGLQSHVSAGFGDIGFKSNWTLELVCTHPIKIYSNMRIGQVYFHRVNSKWNNPQNRYHGKYQDQSSGPIESRSYYDIELTQ